MVDRPAVVTSCCVTSAEALVAQELWMLPGILAAQIDARTGTLEVDFDPDQLSLEQIAEALADIGYPASPAANA
jgi:copper chaperone CopZ